MISTVLSVVAKNRTKNTTYIIRFLLQICQVYFSDFTKQMSTDMLCSTGTIVLTKTVITVRFAIHNACYPFTIKSVQQENILYVLQLTSITEWLLITTIKWSDAQRDGRLAKYTWRPLLNTAKFGSRHCSSAMRYAAKIGERKTWTQHSKWILHLAKFR